MLSEANFLILDEPTNHLDITSKEILEDALNNYTGTVLYVSHDRYFINRTASRILELEDGKLTGYPGNYDYYLEKKEELTSIYAPEQAAEAAAPSVSAAKLDWQQKKEEQARIRKRENDLKKTEKAIEELERKFEEQRILEKKEKAYNECLNTPYKDEAIDTMFTELMSELDNNVSIYFEEINNEYSFTYNENKAQYGASIIKLFEASYLIENARNGNINLDDTITYISNYASIAGLKLRTRTVGEEITIRDLLDYSVSVSDNGAHIMLSDYIGVNTLKEYAKNTLNATLTINESDRYGYLTVTDTNKLLKHIYNLIQIDDEYTNLLVTAMNNTYYNGLNFDNVTFLHKYGYYGSYFNNIGIYNSNNPYLISIFTLYGNPDQGALTKVSKLSKKIYNIYNTNLELKEDYCYSLAYE